MRTLRIIIVCASCTIVAGCGHNTEQRSATGAGSGIVAGAIVAGPVGAVVGAAAGGAGGAAVSKAEDDNHEHARSSGGGYSR